MVPTLHEAGVPDIDIGAWFGVAVPAGTPAPVMQRLNADISRALQQAAVRSKLEEIGGVVAASSPEQAQARVAAELRTWQEVVHKLPPGMLNNP